MLYCLAFGFWRKRKKTRRLKNTCAAERLSFGPGCDIYLVDVQCRRHGPQRLAAWDWDGIRCVNRRVHRLTRAGQWHIIASFFLFSRYPVQPNKSLWIKSIVFCLRLPLYIRRHWLLPVFVEPTSGLLLRFVACLVCVSLSQHKLDGDD